MAFRCFYAMPELTRSDGFPTGAIHAFFSGMVRLLSIEAPHPACAFFDKGGSSRRREIFPEYKANRASMPESMRQQIPAIKDMCDLFGMDVFEESGVEADDLLGSMAVKLRSKGEDVTIVSADKDFAQLVAPHVRQMLPPNSRVKEWTFLDTVGVKTKFGVPPSQIAYFLALTGDAIDNIPGINGVGPKMAAKWLKEYGDLESVIFRSDWLKPEKFRKIVGESAETLRRNLELVKLDTGIPVSDPKVGKPQFGELLKFLDEMEMRKGILSLRKFAKEVYGEEL